MTIEKPTNGRIYRGQSNEERISSRRQKFIDAALQVFGTEGYRAGTVRRLCRETGLSNRYYYESFSSSEELLIAVYNQCMEQIQLRILTVIQEAGVKKDPEALIQTVLGTILEYLEDERIARLVLLEVEGVSEDVDKVYNQAILGHATLLWKLTQGMYPDIPLTEEEGVLLGVSSVGAMRQSIIYWVTQDKKMDRATVQNACSKIFLGFLALIEKEMN